MTVSRQERLGRQADVYEQRLERDLDALARSKPARAYRAVVRNRDTIRIVALGVAAGLVTLALAFVAVRSFRARAT